MFDAGFQRRSLEWKAAPGGVLTEPSRLQIAARDIIVRPPKNWRGVLGARLAADTEITLRVTGKGASRAGGGAPYIAVLGGISANRVCCDDGDEAGWWSQIVGPGRAIDTASFGVVSMDYVAGDGETPLELTPADEADLFAHALIETGVEYLHGFVGASFGGMVALSFARQFPERVGRLAVLCAAHRPAPMAQALRAVQRKILSFALENAKPEEGVALARSLAMTTYRTVAEFDQRFACDKGADGGVSDYLGACGERYAKQMNAVRYLTLSAAIDNHFERPEDITTPTLTIGADSDMIAPRRDLEELTARLAGPARLVTINSLYGHDAFLKEAGTIEPHLRQFISERQTHEH